MQLLEQMVCEGWFKKKEEAPRETAGERMFSQLKRWMDKPFVIDEDDESLLGIFYLAQQLKVPESKIVQTLLDKGDAIHHKLTSALSLLPTLYQSYSKDQKDLLAKTIPEFKTGDPVYNVYIAIDRREESIIYSEKAKSFISLYQTPMRVKRTTLYQAVRKHSDMFPDKFDLETADESLGYYRLQKAPAGVTPKEYPVK